MHKNNYKHKEKVKGIEKLSSLNVSKWRQRNIVIQIVTVVLENQKKKRKTKTKPNVEIKR